MQGFFFWFQFCDVAEVVISIRFCDLARFGYILHMKVEKQTEFFYILGYLLELIIKTWQSEIFFGNLANLGHFFPWKIFV
jgi:hypothetical protein